MSIAITLPLYLWKNILSGEKTIELRKNFPKKFDVNADVVFVIIKGTHRVAGCFRVREFEEVTNTFRMLINPPKGIFVSERWIRKYLQNSDICYLWHIKEIYAFEAYKTANDYLNLKTNPQSFVYV